MLCDPDAKMGVAGCVCGVRVGVGVAQVELKFSNRGHFLSTVLA